jgi:integrase
VRDPIAKVVLEGGRTRYRVTVDVGADPATGRRRQRKATFDTLKDARRWLAEARSAAERGTYIEPARVTLSEHLDAWLESRINIRPSTRRNYRDALRPWKVCLGSVPLDALTRHQVEQVRNELLSGDLRSIGRAGSPLSPRTVRLNLQVLQAALDAAVRDGSLSRNVAAHVEKPSGGSEPGAAWTPEQAQRFAEVAAGDRLHAAWLLTLHGLRRGEVLGLPWAAVDLEQRTIAITQALVTVDGVPQLSGTKTARGRRTLPLPPDVVEALIAFRRRQDDERRAAGSAYVDSGFVVRDELGRALRPESYSDQFVRLSQKAGLPRIRLHDARHTSVTLKRSQGWPDHLVALWHGHDESVMRGTYTHPYLADLRRHAEGPRHAR